ncbi:hypothetical protein [Nocardia jejuensis]|uniref:hypothetical protein n=1 Tax=Nocardia jejuensis TaxID=328049 RepID=UPI001FE09172|nr:hypothetical protein [Nocardia jejuensis]
MPALRTLHIPVLALWGQYDVQVPPAESATILTEELRASPSVTIGILPGAAHNGRSTDDGFDRLGTTPGPGAPRGAFTPGYFDAITSWVHKIATGTLPTSSVDALPRQTVNSVDLSHSLWTSARIQLIATAALILAFAAGLLKSFTDPSTRPTRTTRRFARLLACSGLLSIFGTVLYVVSILAFDARTAGPIVASRPLAWLILQISALLTVALLAGTATTAVRARSHLAVRNRITVGGVLLAGCLWLAWATTWGVFSA